MVAVRPPPAAPTWADSLFTVGVTGTNGKTSTTATIAALLATVGRPVARVTTVGSFLDDEQLEVPGQYEGFLETMRRCVAAGGRYAEMYAAWTEHLGGHDDAESGQMVAAPATG